MAGFDNFDHGDGSSLSGKESNHDTVGGHVRIT